MKLSDVMSASGLSVYAIVALVLFVIAFVGVLIMTFRPGAAERHRRDARLPLDNDDPTKPTDRAEE